LICNIADALQACHSRYEKLKKMNNTQKVEHDLIQLGMLLVMQMHCNDTETSNDHSWKDTLQMMRDQHFEDLRLDKVREEKEISDIAPVQATHSENKDVDSKIDFPDSDDNSDDDSMIVSKNTKLRRSNIFEDDDESEQQNACDKETNAEMITDTSMNQTPVNDGDKSRETTDKAVMSLVNNNNTDDMEMDVNKTDAPNDTEKSRTSNNNPEAEIGEYERTDKEHEKQTRKKMKKQHKKSEIGI
jgi:hypothetical protein